jgi:drug/metabolite transporter (DMT)-like permease
MGTSSTTLKTDSLLLIAAVIWGFAFVAQRVGMDFVGPFGFNGGRFALGCLVLLPFLFRNGMRDDRASPLHPPCFPTQPGGAAGGLVLSWASFQQVA